MFLSAVLPSSVCIIRMVTLAQGAVQQEFAAATLTCAAPICRRLNSLGLLQGSQATAVLLGFAQTVASKVRRTLR